MTDHRRPGNPEQQSDDAVAFLVLPKGKDDTVAAVNALRSAAGLPPLEHESSAAESERPRQ